MNPPTTGSGIIQQSEVAAALPAGFNSSISFDTDKLFLVIPEPYSLLLQVAGSWGSSEAQIVGYVRRPDVEPFDFLLVVALSHLNHSDLFRDKQLATEVTTHLPNPSATLSIFEAWPGISKEKFDETTHLHPDATTAIDAIKKAGDFVKASSDSRKTGISIELTVALPDLSGSPDSVLHKLDAIQHAAGSSSISELVLSCSISKGDMHADKHVDSITFDASLDALALLDSVAFKNVDLALSISRAEGSKAPLGVNMKLSGNVILGIFNAKDPWVTVGALTIDKDSQTALLTVAPSTEEHHMPQLGAFRLDNFNFQVLYSFGQQTSVKTSLSLDVTLGNHKSEGVVLFDGIHPSLIFFVMEGTLAAEDLLKAILQIDFVPDLLKFTLTDLRFSYSWNSAVIVLPEVPDKKTEEARRTFAPGFTAQARVTAFEVSFNALLRLVPTGPKKGIFISTKLINPIDLYIVSCYGANDPASGPVITYGVNDAEDSGLVIDCGLAVVGLKFNAVQIHSGKSIQGNYPCLSVKLNLESSFIAGGHYPVMLEFLKIEGETRIRLNGVPLSDIVDAFTGKQLMDKIKELTKKDPKSKCGEIDIPSFIENKWSMKIDFSKHQPHREKGQPLRCSFDIYGTWKIIFAPTDEEIAKIELKPMSLVMNVPNTWEDVWKEVFKSIANSIDDIVKSLLENVEEFSKILAFYAVKFVVEEWMKAALRAWLCRYPRAPVPLPRKEPQSEPTPPPPQPPVPLEPLMPIPQPLPPAPQPLEPVPVPVPVPSPTFPGPEPLSPSPVPMYDPGVDTPWKGLVDTFKHLYGYKTEKEEPTTFPFHITTV